MRLSSLWSSALLCAAVTSAQGPGGTATSAQPQPAGGANTLSWAMTPTGSPAAPPGTGPNAGAATTSPAAARPGGAAPPAVSTSAAEPTATGSAPAATHTVTVGGTGNKFIPENTNVSPGDTVIFSFAGSSHNVIQSDTKGACSKSADPSAFAYPPSGGLAAQGATFTFVVPPTATKNVWFYCAPHCQAGMTGGLILGGGTSTGANSTGSSSARPPSASGTPASAAAAGPRGLPVFAAVAGAAAVALAAAGH